jgi:hypothetical protein
MNPVERAATRDRCNDMHDHRGAQEPKFWLRSKELQRNDV